MDCCCEMEPGCTRSRRIAVSASLVLLEEKYRRSHAFGKYLEQHPATCPLTVELHRQNCMYRIALHNLIQSIKADEKPKLHAVGE